MVTATGGKDGDDGTFCTGTNGQAVVFAGSIGDSDDTTDWSGVIFQRTAGRV